ncbi:dolichol kinase [Prochlorococcus sp. MIT 1223]|uniref:diacylglycerol/polyprenol kinase family protein n=1 Tax=Prochlorococcus sp. MIT 1223 TaxID=3096217 RepID=UPI002A75475D|nr:dolichol kinase [Prochlorococcus sp. MIT 1223]
MANVNLIVVIFTWLIIIFIISWICQKKFPNNKELVRKIIHIGSGPIIPFAWLIEVSKELAIFICASISLALYINHRFRIISSMEDIERKSYGTIFYGISITLLIILFWPNNSAAVTAGVLIMALGDGLAGLIGKGLKSPTWLIFGQNKSTAGTLTMGIVSGLVLSIMVYLTGEFFDPLKLLIITAIAVLLEQISFRGIDNLTVPLGVSSLWVLMISN